MKKLKQVLDNLKSIWNLPAQQKQDIKYVILWLNQIENRVGEHTEIHAYI